MVNIQKFSLRIVKESGGRYDIDKYVRNPFQARDLFVEVVELDRRAEEVFAIATIDVKNKVTGVFEVSTGTLTSSLVTPREVFKRAILQNAAGIVLAHNHPSGVADASSDDISITKKLQKAGKIMGINVVDHIIIGSRDNFISMQEENLMKD
ncbi:MULTISPECIES: JAB domain-containing protein [Halanaerobium]|jgi:DNA repair protein RadC|uniref:DNA repair protein RadC n=2 Tax=Halanaerobium TaxID=2330 RepID=A0A1M7L723_9FIRM|nr:MULTISPECIES: JAB domain-containing protein [Halanaerobium]PTX17695.1 DNA repair protein RadC [Halanaerobium congolense]PUU85988.1 MAG: DNA repair protein RadC [Halanaerobium sp.]PUU90145.1 MAG: DNA repair protein RadC [Halanaerobium sp.]SDF83210.1 DNA repair protein RadC [Halanaerobium congolense]SDI71330.1 DNA repair protein RadC [Halanaerobium congolense]